ncbi:serine/threonine protein kinase [Kineococcus xinjiangensis]|uniref:non-specific serine/threonine protein kinase n=1 Tax=Kineococcus xinjiangensis TaxID=512762 RepID=A0A2S6IMG3_9ACTN|nr:serine/threonine-protein kinase [Kineococcus xinjiangensis]PPK95330.1 serine/threonine protein kinase [Kineococcus xinjiangensis]
MQERDQTRRGRHRGTAEPGPAATAPDRPGAPPPQVDGYAVGRMLGAGGSASVWEGTGPDGLPCALKVLEETPAAAGAADPLLRELSLLRRVRHPSVVAVRDISTTAEGRPVLVLDLAAGGSLAALVRRRRLVVGEVVTLLLELGPALEDLHATGVVHADISPGNVLLRADGTPLLADLGVARVLGEAGGWLHATTGYCDPAVAAGGSPGAASDVYGLAAVAWFALTGSPPPAAGRLGRRRAGRALPEGVPAELTDLLLQALDPPPNRRPAPVELAVGASEAAPARPLRVVAAGPAPYPDPSRGPDPFGAVAAGGERPAPGDVPSGAVVPGAVASGVVASAAGPEPAAPDEYAVTRRLRALAVGPAEAAPTGEPGPDGRRTRRLGAEGRAGRRGARAGGDAPARRRRSADGARSRRTGRLLGGGAVLALLAATAVLLLPQTGDAAAGSTAAPGGRAGAASPDRDAPTEPGGTPPDATSPATARTTPEAGALPAVDAAPALDPPPAAAPADEDLHAVVVELAQRRAHALEAGDSELLTAVDSPGSPALAADVELLAAHREQGTSWRGLSFDVRSVQVEVAGPERTVLLADVVTRAHQRVDRHGAVEEVAATDPRRSRVTLVRVEGEWRVSAIG